MQTPGLLLMSNMAPGNIDTLTGYAKQAEAIGLRNFLVTESMTDSLALAQHFVSHTDRIQVGTGITNLYLRHPLLAALHVMTIDQLAPGRMLLGLGTSHVPVNAAFGISMDKPLTALREYITSLSRIFRGEDEALAAMASRGIPVPRPSGKFRSMWPASRPAVSASPESWPTAACRSTMPRTVCRKWLTASAGAPSRPAGPPPTCRLR